MASQSIFLYAGQHSDLRSRSVSSYFGADLVRVSLYLGASPVCLCFCIHVHVCVCISFSVAGIAPGAAAVSQARSAVAGSKGDVNGGGVARDGTHGAGAAAAACFAGTVAHADAQGGDRGGSAGCGDAKGAADGAGDGGADQCSHGPGADGGWSYL